MNIANNLFHRRTVVHVGPHEDGVAHAHAVGEGHVDGHSVLGREKLDDRDAGERNFPHDDEGRARDGRDQFGGLFHQLGVRAPSQPGHTCRGQRQIIKSMTI